MTKANAQQNGSLTTTTTTSDQKIMTIQQQRVKLMPTTTTELNTTVTITLPNNFLSVLCQVFFRCQLLRLIFVSVKRKKAHTHTPQLPPGF